MVNHLLPPHLFPVDLVLGQSWISDLGQGNFAEANNIAQKALAHKKNTITLLARGIVHQLQGEYHQALALLEEGFSSTNNLELQYIIALVGYKTQQQAQLCLPDGSSSINNAEVIDRVVVNLTTSSWGQKLIQLKDQIKGNNIRLIGQYTARIANTIPYLRTYLQIHQSGKPILDRVMQMFTKEIELAQKLHEDKIAQSLYSIMAELLGWGGETATAVQILTQLAHIHRQGGNNLELAYHLLAKADILASTYPLGHPIVFGYRLHDRAETPFDPQAQIEQREKLRQTIAQNLYLESRKHFATAQARRGEGITTTRLAYMNAIAGQWHLAALGYEEAVAIFQQQGDQINAAAAGMGKIWARMQCQTNSASALIEQGTQLAQQTMEQGVLSWSFSWAVAFGLAAIEAILIEQEEPSLDIAVGYARLSRAILGLFRRSSPLVKSLWQSLCVTSIWQQLYTKLVQKSIDLNDRALAFELVQLASEFGGAKTTAVTLDRVGDYLSGDRLLLVYAPLAWGYLVWGIAQYSPIYACRQHPNLTADLQQWLKALATNQTDFDLSAVYIHLLQPLVEAVETSKHLLVLVPAQIEMLPLHTLVWRQKYLGHQKPISYLFHLQQLSIGSIASKAETDSLASGGGIMVVNQTAATDSDQEQSQLVLRAWARGCSELVTKLYQPELILNQSQSWAQAQLVHLHTLKDEISPELIQQLLPAEVLIWNWQHQSQSNLKSTYMELIEAGAKALVVKLWPSTYLSDTILLTYMHQFWLAGQSLAESLSEAQAKLSKMSVSEAIYFCNQIQSLIPPRQTNNLAQRAVFTRYMGDLMVWQGDLLNATQAYKIAATMFEQTGYTHLATATEKLASKYHKRPNFTRTQNQIFAAPHYWGNWAVFGDGQTSFRPQQQST